MSDTPIFDKLARQYVRRHTVVRVTPHPGAVPGQPLWTLSVTYLKSGYGWSMGTFTTIQGVYREARRIAVDAWRLRHGQ